MKQEKHAYEYKIGLDSDSGPARVVRLVGEDRRVLEIGSGPGSITKILASVSKCRVTALDIDPASIQKVAPYCEQTYLIDLNRPNWTELVSHEHKFEVIVAADVLEHVYDPLTVLKAMATFLDSNACMVISLPHAGHAVIHACLLDEDFEYGDSGLLDRTHIRFFGLKNMQKLIEDANLKIIHAEFVVRNPEHTEFARRWSKSPALLRDILELNPFGLVYQVILKVVTIHSDGVPVQLMNMSVLPQQPSVKESIKSFVRSHCNTTTYLRFQKIVDGIRFHLKL